MNQVAWNTQVEPVTMDPNEIPTVQQAARVLQVSCSHILRRIRSDVTGMPPVHQVRAGVSVRVRRGALAQWITAAEHHCGSSPARDAQQ